jgi:hypothetical protein
MYVLQSFNGMSPIQLLENMGQDQCKLIHQHCTALLDYWHLADMGLEHWVGTLPHKLTISKHTSLLVTTLKRFMVVAPVMATSLMAEYERNNDGTYSE